MGKTKAYKKAPLRYPRCPFYTIRTLQILSSTIVTGIMFYFIYRLVRDKLALPWMFYFLFASALITLIMMVITTLFHCCHVLTPILNGYVNTFLFVLWVIGFALLAFAMRNTIKRSCTKELWGDRQGVVVCGTYRLLLVAALFGTLSTFAACVLDFVTHKRQLKKGKYVKANNPSNTNHLHLIETRYYSN